MKRAVRYGFVVLVALAVSLPAMADDQGKAKKEINKFVAMATDGTGRRMVNLSMAEMFSVKRSDLVMERRDTGMNYGAIFIAHELMSKGAKLSDISTQLKAGKDIFKIADEQHADWKAMASEAKKLNSKLDDNLYKNFADPKGSEAKDQADNYSLALDGVNADAEASKDEISQAQDRYMRVKDRAEEIAKRDSRLNTADQNAAYRDNVRSAGPQSQGGASGGAPPAAGGPR